METILEKQSIFTLITWLNGCIGFLLGILSLFADQAWYVSLFLFAGSLTAFVFYHISKRDIACRCRDEIFLSVFYVLMLPGCYIITGIEMCELPIYFMVGIIFTAVILKGRRRTLLMALELAADCGAIWYVTCYLSDGSYDTPSLSSVHYLRLLIAVVMAGLAGGALLEYRNRLLLSRIKSSRERSREARRANLARDSFMANVSHEISVPLSQVTETAKVLLSLDVDPQRKEDLYYIENTGRNMLSVTDALLNFARKGKEDPDRRENSERIYREIVKSINHASDPEGAGASSRKFICPQATILVVDDNLINGEILQSMLEPYQCQSFFVSSGKECLAFLENRTVDLIFLDYIMPEMDGMETLKRIRAEYASVPVIALTANVVSGAKERFLAGGFNAYMAKPVELAALRQILKQFLPEYKVVDADKEFCKHPSADMEGTC